MTGHSAREMVAWAAKSAEAPGSDQGDHPGSPWSGAAAELLNVFLGTTPEGATRWRNSTGKETGSAAYGKATRSATSGCITSRRVTGRWSSLLHGFPEFWYGWRRQIQPLAAAGFHVVAPDTRGYNLSPRPKEVAAYDGDKLAADIRDLIHERGTKTAMLVGHDWGGTIAWTMAMHHPEVVERLAILNAAHPRKLSQGLHHPGQLRKSWYFFFFVSRNYRKPSCTPTTGTSSGTS